MSEKKYTSESIVTKSDMLKTFWRTFPLQASFNFERMQNIGFCYSMITALKRIYDNKEDMGAALQRHLSFFNITPQMSSFITGACIALEEKNKKLGKNGFDIESITALKVALMGPLSGIGDSFFWGTFRVIAAGIGCDLSLRGSILGPMMFLLVFNIPHLLIRWYGLKIGYESGFNFIEQVQSSGMLEKLTVAAKVMGLCVIGSMISSMVSFSTWWTLAVGGTEIKIQSIFDSILPNVLPLILTFVLYKFLQNGYKTTMLMFGLIAFGIVAAFIGVC
jgi:PTS system mannose-specific IID component/fructoselysine and glucoselysine-specific PTS system IID component